MTDLDALYDAWSTPDATPPTPKPSGPSVHMLKARAADVATTRCGRKIATRGATLPEVDVTGWESRVTCPDCTLKEKS